MASVGIIEQHFAVGNTKVGLVSDRDHPCESDPLAAPREQSANHTAALRNQAETPGRELGKRQCFVGRKGDAVDQIDHSEAIRAQQT